MTTEEQRQGEGGNDSVPRYFADFIGENARQHAELGAGIAAVKAELGASIAETKGELRIIKALAFAFTGAALATAGAALVALSKYVFGW